MVVLPYIVELWPVVFSACAEKYGLLARLHVYMYYDLVGCQLCAIIELVLWIQRCHNYTLLFLQYIILYPIRGDIKS